MRGDREHDEQRRHRPRAAPLARGAVVRRAGVAAVIAGGGAARGSFGTGTLFHDGKCRQQRREPPHSHAAMRALHALWLRSGAGTRGSRRHAGDGAMHGTHRRYRDAVHIADPSRRSPRATASLGGLASPRRRTERAAGLRGVRPLVCDGLRRCLISISSLVILLIALRPPLAAGGERRRPCAGSFCAVSCAGGLAA